MQERPLALVAERHVARRRDGLAAAADRRSPAAPGCRPVVREPDPSLRQPRPAPREDLGRGAGVDRAAVRAEGQDAIGEAPGGSGVVGDDHDRRGAALPHGGDALEQALAPRRDRGSPSARRARAGRAAGRGRRRERAAAARRPRGGSPGAARTRPARRSPAPPALGRASRRSTTLGSRARTRRRRPPAP